MVGNIIDIKRFTVHDGIGIRSTVFLKGCPLKCQWCHNPEGIENKISLWYFQNKCIKCNKCIASCPSGALSKGGEYQPDIMINRLKCINSGKCLDVCPTNALCFDGKQIDSEEVARILLKDRLFYNHSGGGITLSGGEPTYQYDFSLEILEECKKQHLHTAIETCMYTKKDILGRFIEYTNLFIVDLKIFDSKEHMKYTGMDNELILSNFKYLASQHLDILVRIPLIPGITTTLGNIKNISRFVYNMNNDIPIELMNYNTLAESKYRLMNKNFQMYKDLKPLCEKELNELYQIISDEGVKVIKNIKI